MTDNYVFVIGFETCSPNKVRGFRVAIYDGEKWQDIRPVNFADIRSIMSNGFYFLNKSPKDSEIDMVAEAKDYIRGAVYAEYGTIAYDLFLTEIDNPNQPQWLQAVSSLCIGETPYILDGVARPTVHLVGNAAAIKTVHTSEYEVARVLEDLWKMTFNPNTTPARRAELLRPHFNSITSIYNMEDPRC